MFKIVSVSCLCFALTACKTTRNTGDVKIVNGIKPARGSVSATSTVGLVVRKKAKSFVPVCTATLITQDLLVTAAHCFEGVGSREIYAVFNNQSDFSNPENNYRIKEWKVFPKWNLKTTIPNYDVAWARLARPAPAEHKPIEVLRSSALLKTRPKATIAGYGKTASRCEQGCSGVLFEAETEITSFIENEKVASLMVVQDAKDLQAPCYGDSGGPAYVQKEGSWFLAGATHGYHTPTSGFQATPGRECESGHILYTFVGAYLEWIQTSAGVTLKFDNVRNPAATAEEKSYNEAP